MPSYSIIEKACVGKTGNERDNEDGFAFSDSYIVVADGVTSKSSSKWDGMNPGVFAKKSILDSVSSIPEAASYHEAFSILKESLSDDASRASISGIDPDEEIAYPSASVAIASIERNEVWILGDCFCLIDSQFVSSLREEKELDNARQRSKINSILISSGWSPDSVRDHDLGRLSILKNLRCEETSKNRACLSAAPGLSFALESGYVQTYSFSPGSEIVLASDGYPYLFPTLQESEARLSEILARDPLLILDFLSTKGLIPGNVSYDDRTYVRFFVSDSR